MNSFNLSRLWFSFAYDNTYVKPVHTALYFWIVERANASGWKKIIDIQTEKSMECLGITDWRTYKNALQFLADNSFVLWVEKSKNQFTCNRISLVENAFELTETFKNATAQNAKADAEAIAEAIAEAYPKAYVEAIAEALQSYINLKTDKPKTYKLLKDILKKKKSKFLKFTWKYPECSAFEYTTWIGNKEKPKEKTCAKKEKVQEHYFEQSPYYDRKFFLSSFTATSYPISEHPNTDTGYYYEQVKHWAEYGSGNNPGKQKKKDWLATARTFMKGDIEKGKLKLKTPDLKVTRNDNPKERYTFSKIA